MSAAPSGSLPPLSEEERAIFANAIRQATRLCESGVLDGLEAEIAAGAGTGGEG